MENAVDDDLGCLHLKEDAVGKPRQQRPPHRGIDKLIGFRMAPDGRETGAEGLKELVSEAGTLLVVRVLPSVFELGPYLPPGLRRRTIARVRTTTPGEFPPLRVSHGDGSRRCRKAVPDLLDQLQAILGAERERVLQYRAHACIFRWELRSPQASISVRLTLPFISVTSVVAYRLRYRISKAAR